MEQTTRESVAIKEMADNDSNIKEREPFMKRLISKFNPAAVLFLTGQMAIGFDFQPIGWLPIIYNFCFIIAYMCLFGYAWTTAGPEEKYGSPGYSFISQIKYVIQLYGSSAFMCYISYRQTMTRVAQSKSLLYFYEYCIELNNLNLIKVTHLMSDLAAIQVSLLILVPLAAITDVYRTPRPISTSMWFCLYLPGLSIMLYVMGFVGFTQGYIFHFRRINEKLKEFAYLDLSCTELYELKKRGINADELLKTLPDSHLNMLDLLLRTHDKICQGLQMVNKTYGFPILIFYFLTSSSALSLFYHTILDLVSLTKGGIMSDQNTRACDYWIVLSFMSMILLTATAISTDDERQKTKQILVRLINIYPELEAHGDIYVLQLAHQSSNMTAADFFTLDRTVVYGLISSWVTYLIVLIQFTDS